MTPQEKVVAYAKSQVGYYATAAKRNKYAQALDAMGYIYNGAKNGYDWCDVFADYDYIHCFGAETAIRMIAQPKYGCGAGCPYSARYYREAGQWSDSPSLGAQIFFGTVGAEGHTGIVVGYDSMYVYTVEGNVGGGGGMVGARTHVRGQGIAGYGVPNWSLAPSEIFTDVDESTPHYEDIKWCKENGIAKGYGDGTFRPNDILLRQDAATFLHRLAGTPIFTDVPDSSDVAWMAAKGIAKGFPDGSFRPSSPVARADFAEFLYRMAGEPEFSDASAFEDVDDETPHARAIRWLGSTGISKGYGDGTFRPSAYLTRGDAAAFLHRAASHIE